MKVQVFKAWNRLRTSVWFLPTVMAGAAIFMALVTVHFDKPITKWLSHHWGFTFTGGAEGSSALLSTIAGSMITIAGVVFSMTLVVLSLASSQLGPRLLRNFMRDTMTQIVLGTFVATFLFCLLVLRTIRRADEIVFVPHLSVSLGVVFAVMSVGVLIYFIHHVSVSIQANDIVARVGTVLIEGMENLFPESIGQDLTLNSNEPPDAGFLERFDREARSIRSREDGYLQFIDGDALMALAIKAEVIILLERRPGHYVIAKRTLVKVWPASKVNDLLIDKIIAAFALGEQRTSGQDIEYAVNQLVEIAVRALSPGVNDPFTAIACVDQLGSALARLAEQDKPSSYRYDQKNQLRLITPLFNFSDVTDAAFNQIRQYSRASTAVSMRLLETIAEIAISVTQPEDRAALLRHAEMIVRGAYDGLPEDEDRDSVEQRFQLAYQALTKGN
jgi:uncharacterized membrane protein